MAYKLKFRGIEIHCDSLEEARDMALALAESQSEESISPRPPRRSHSVPLEDAGGETGWNEEKLKRLKYDISYSNAEKIIRALLEHPKGRTDEDLRTLLGLSDNRALAGVTAGITKHAKRLNADIMLSTWDADQGCYLYRLVPSFIAACEKYAWPE